jgi:hypothetical protein
MRVTRQRAARERLHQQQQQMQQQIQQQQAPTSQQASQPLQPQQPILPAVPVAPQMTSDPMIVESFNLDPLAVRDPQLCHHYTKEIYSYLRDLELEHRVPPHFMQVRLAPLLLPFVAPCQLCAAPPCRI